MHRPQQDLPSGGQGQFGRRGVRRQLSRRDAARDGAQVNAWRILVRVSRARYGIPLDHVYALSDRLQGCALLRRLCLGEDCKGVGRETPIAPFGDGEMLVAEKHRVVVEGADHWHGRRHCAVFRNHELPGIEPTSASRAWLRRHHTWNVMTFLRIVIRLLGRPAAQRGASGPDSISRLSTAPRKSRRHRRLFASIRHFKP